MKIYATVAVLLLVSALIPGCATVSSYATCENARLTIEAAQRAADALCPIAPAPDTVTP